MEILLFFAAIALAAVFFFVRGAGENGRKKRKLREEIHASFGKPWKREYTDEELSGIPGFYMAHRKES